MRRPCAGPHWPPQIAQPGPLQRPRPRDRGQPAGRGRLRRGLCRRGAHACAASPACSTAGRSAPFEYPLEGHAVRAGGRHRIPPRRARHGARVQVRQLFAAKGMDSYAAYPLCDSNGFQLGLLVAMDRAAARRRGLAEAVLKIIGSRIAVELERASADAVLRTAALAVSNARGASVFAELGALRSRRSCASTWPSSPSAFRTQPQMLQVLAMQLDGEPVDEWRYDAAGHALRSRAERGLHGLHRRRRRAVPDRRALLEHQIAAYAGHPLHDLDGAPVGLLSIASRKPLWHPERIESMMQIFAVAPAPRSSGCAPRRRCAARRRATARSSRPARTAS